MLIDREWVTSLPKAENHVHLEGCLDGAVLAAAASRAGVEVPTGVATNLDELLRVLDVNCRLATEPSDLFDLAVAKAEAADAQGVVYTDLIVNPAHWPTWRDRLDEMLAALDAGLAHAERAGSAPTALSLSIGRNQDERYAAAVVDALIASPSRRVVGVSIDGNESAPGAGCERFVPAINRAREAGLRIHVHTGESGGADHMWRNLDHLAPDRIDHGIAAIGDAALVERLVELQVPLAMCPTSNLTLGVVDSLAAHPIAVLRAAGVAVTVNTDDPLLFGTDLVNEYLLVAEAFGWTGADLVELAAASIRASSAPTALHAQLMANLEAFVESMGASHA